MMIGKWMIIGNAGLEFCQRIERRVPGGYMNRWLIREVTYRPNRDHILVDKFQRLIICHPALIREIEKGIGTRSID